MVTPKGLVSCLCRRSSVSEEGRKGSVIQAAEVEQGFEGRAPLQAEGQERRGTAGVGADCLWPQ